MPIKDMVEEHIVKMDHIFGNPNYKKHSYLAVPEQYVMKEGKGTPLMFIDVWLV